MSVVIVIPSRMASTRFPGKPLCDLVGKPMVQWVYEAAVRSGLTDRIVVATPDQEIVEACSQFGAETILTSDVHPSGTDRIAEVATKISADVYVNIQGDEPLVNANDIRACAQPLLAESTVSMGSVMADCPEHEEDNHAVVKVVTDLEGFALYFSRHAIPFARNERVRPLKKHIGLYAYTGLALRAFSTWKQTPLEVAESLEQLRFLEHGLRIKMSQGTGSAFGVDTPEQAEAVRKLIEAGHVSDLA
ncbi:3-deoxy-manno-octulosonate cytidylyltransferase [Kamptonema cortianum]|nr:3-deoxy-manno-octulosonate cytidylyltransferase [Geitlerinema splendidum]MDK3158337.1 3-deoxy-manno-octulosonate cytidylyltransferase [Kamptonema cortianum]